MKINNLTNFKGGLFLAGYIDVTKDQLVQKLGNPLPATDSTGLSINSLLIPTAEKSTTAWVLDFEDGSIATIFDNTATENPNDWHIGVDSPATIEKLEKFLNIKVEPQYIRNTPEPSEVITFPVFEQPSQQEIANNEQ